MPQAKTARNTPALAKVLKWVGMALGLSLVLVFSVQFYRDSARPGELVFEPDSVDVGQVAIGQQVIQRFSMRNVGAAPVTITRKSASAVEGC